MKFENSNQRWRNSLEGDKVTGVNGRLSRGWRAGYRGEPSRGNSRWLDDLCCKNKIEDMKDSIVNIIKRNRRYYFYRNYSFKIALTFSSFSLRREIFLFIIRSEIDLFVLRRLTMKIVEEVNRKLGLKLLFKNGTSSTNEIFFIREAYEKFVCSK